MADSGRTLEATDDGSLVEAVANEPEVPLGVELLPVVGDDAGRLLSAMLEGMETERGQGARIRVAEDAEDAALLAQAVVAVLGVAQITDRQIGLSVVRHGCLPLKHPLRWPAATVMAGLVWPRL